MTRYHDPDPGFDPRVADWLEADPVEAPGQVLETVLAALPSIPQRRAARPPRRSLTMNRFAYLAAAAIAAVAVIAGGVLLKSPSPTSGPQTNPTTAPTSSEAPSLSHAPTVAPTEAQVGTGSWMLTGSMHHSRSYETATLLQDGRVLVAGGEIGNKYAGNSAELYDPATGQWTDTGSMHAARRGHTATVLADGRVLVAGGWNLAAQPQAPLFAELYDPASGTWSKTGNMTRWRYNPLATLLSDGRVLVAGGLIDGLVATKGAELYDPEFGTWSWARPMIASPASATRLPDGKVLVMHSGLSPELYDPGSGRWTETASPTRAPGFPKPTLLANGKVLMLRSAGATIDGAELYDRVSGTWSPTERPLTGSGPATLLSDGTVLLVGRDASGRYDPGSGTWAAVPRPPLPRDYALDSSEGVEVDFVIRLLDGRILAAEGGAVAVFDPSGTP